MNEWSRNPGTIPVGRIEKNGIKVFVIRIQVHGRYKCNTSPSAFGERSEGQNRLLKDLK
jgi:hypothetical protein